MYAKAPNKSQIIGVLADLTLSTRAEMREFLGVDGQYPTAAKMDCEKAMELYNAGMSDGQMAEKLGVSRQAVSGWRVKNRLSRPTPHKVRHAEYMSLYERGYVDRIIAERVGVCCTTVRNWRRKHGLPANGSRGGDRRLYADIS